MKDQSLPVVDNRTGIEYLVPIKDGSIDAARFAAMSSSEGNGENSGHPPIQGLKVLDEGLRNTVVMKSSVSYLDSERGRLQYRGKSIEELVSNHSYEEVAYLLIWGCDPTKAELQHFSAQLVHHMQPPAQLFDVVKSFRRNGAAISMISAGLSAVGATESHKIPMAVGSDIYFQNMALVEAEIPRVLATFATVVGVVFCHVKGIEFTPADPGLPFVENTLRMCGLLGDEDLPKVRARRCKYLEQCMILYAEHGMANATASFLMSASTGANPIFSVQAALGGLYGPLHGGAVAAVHVMLRKTGRPKNVKRLMVNVKARKEILFGYGHRIYRTTDRRCKVFRRLVDELRGDQGQIDSTLLSTALEIDRVASTDDFFVKRKIQANADLYASLVLTGVGVPDDFVGPFLSVARNLGFMAHWREFMGSSRPTWRPTHIYTGAQKPDQAKL